MKRSPSLLLLTVLVAFPQLSETIYAPALPKIAEAFSVSATAAQWTMSIYFIAFAIGVVCWGRCADYFGRRVSMLAGLACYALGASAALLAEHFATLLTARFVLAFGASAGSVVVQTMLRDLFQGSALAKVFSLIGMALSLSPALGPLLGALLVHHNGHFGIFIALCVLAYTLLTVTSISLPETRPARSAGADGLLKTGKRLLADPHVLICTWWVAGLNIVLFGFYTLTPFTLRTLQLPEWMFGASGVMIAVGSALGAWINRLALSRHEPQRLIAWSITASLVAALAQWCALSTASEHIGIAMAGWMVSQFVLVLAYGCAIPNLLAIALTAYAEVRGTAAAMFGLYYYLLIGAGLWLIGACYQPSSGYQGAAMAIICALMLPALLIFHRGAKPVRLSP